MTSALLVCAPCWVGLHGLCHIDVYDAANVRHACRCASLDHAKHVAGGHE